MLKRKENMKLEGGGGRPPPLPTGLSGYGDLIALAFALAFAMTYAPIGGGGGALPISTIVYMCRSEGSLLRSKAP